MSWEYAADRLDAINGAAAAEVADEDGVCRPLGELAGEGVAVQHGGAAHDEEQLHGAAEHEGGHHSDADGRGDDAGEAGLRGGKDLASRPLANKGTS